MSKSLNETKLQNLLTELQMALATDNLERKEYLVAQIELIKADMRLRDEYGVKP